MKKMYFIGCLIFLLGWSSTSSAQHANYTYDSGWFFGLNIGSTYQRSDVNDRYGLGGGFTIGKSITPREGRLLSLDLRLQALWGFTHGQDYARNTSLTDNSVFNGSRDSVQFTNSGRLASYQDSTGYVYNNYRMRLNEWSLDLVLNANRLRERTGILLYGYAGIGITKYQTYTDQLDADGNIYNYGAIDSIQSRSNISDLISLRDNDYETTAEKSEEAQFKFMPTLGLGLGYEFTPRFSMALEHKLTFTLEDYADGVAAVNNPAKWYGDNDVYHYTGVRFIWRIRRGNTNYDQPDPDIDDYSTVTPPPNGGGGTVTTGGGGGTPPPTGIPPVVKITTPSACPISVDQNLFNFRATVLNVSGRNDIRFFQNGNPNNSFQYNSSTKIFTGNVVLQPGNNVFEIRGTNAFGTDSKSCAVVFEQPQIVNIPPPIVTITNPPNSPHSTNANTFNIQATILNIDGPQNVTFRVNGNVTQNFAYNPNTKLFTSNINLGAGTTTVQIVGTNSVGSDTKMATLVKQTAQVLPPPIVTFTNPATSPTTVNTPNITVTATVFNVTSQSDIKLRINGSFSNNFTYNTGTKVLAVNANLSEGTTVFEVTGTNTVGSDTKTTVIKYEKIQNTLPPPIVTFTSPTNGFQTSNAQITVSANVLNVLTQNDIFLKINGVSHTNFNFNPSSKQMVIPNANLTPGVNTFEVTGVNTVGSDVKTWTVVRVAQEGPPPVVTISTPSTNPHNTTVSAGTLIAKVINVNSPSNITVKVNGVNTTAFGYNVTTKVLSLNYNLNVGSNNFEIAAFNAFGNDQKSTVIIYTEPIQTGPPPVITVTQPIVNPHTIDKSTGTVVAKIINVSGSGDVSCKVNGVVHTNFTYNVNTKQFNTNSRLVEGANTFEIKATNQWGSDVKSTVIIYEPMVVTGLPPVVTITDPNTSPKLVTTNTYALKGIVRNVDNKSQITYTLNGGMARTDFTFNTSNKRFTSTVPLREGTNTIVIKGTNPWGSDTKSTVIVYNKPLELGKPPVVTFTSPASTPHVNGTQQVTVKGTILNIQSKTQSTLKINGATSTSYSYNSATKMFQITYLLPEGVSTFEMSASNKFGQDSKQMQIEYRPPLPAPNLNVTTPYEGAVLVTNGTYTILGTVNHISSKSQMSVKVNGSLTTNFTYNNTTKAWTIPLNLNVGVNTINIQATNNAGTVSRPVTVTYNPATNGGMTTGGSSGGGSGSGGSGAVNPPQISMTVPPSSPFTSPQSSGVVKGKVFNIDNIGDMTVKLNGSIIQHGYSMSTKAFSANVSLNNGSNTIVVTATNSAGSVSKTVIINYYAAPANTGGGSTGGGSGTTGGKITPKTGTVVVPKPTIKATNPASGSATTAATSYKVTAVVKGVKTKSYITVKNNGSSKTFSWSSSSGALTANIPLSVGMNTIVITAGSGRNKVTKTIKVTRTAVRVGGSTPKPRGGR